MKEIDTIRDIQDLIDRAKAVGMLGWRKAQKALAALSTIDPDAIRINCACRAGLYIESVHELDGYHIDRNMLELAILATEPAREGS